MADDVSNSESFYAGAYGRIVRFMVASAVGASAVVLWRWGLALAAGFMLGSAIALLNFYWLKQTVAALADRLVLSAATDAGEVPKSGSSRRIVLRFLLRYLWIALAAYAIFKISKLSVYGLLIGLTLPVAGILIEAGYELYFALRRGL